MMENEKKIGLQFTTTDDPPIVLDEEPKRWRYRGHIEKDRIPITISVCYLQDVDSLNIYTQSILTMLRLSHPGVIKNYDLQFKQTSEGLYEVTELTEPLDESLARDLAERRETQRWYSEAELWRILTDLIKVLHFAQDQGVCHRNINPENCYWCNGQIKLGGFEHAAGHLEIQRSRTTLVGRKTYYSPELRTVLAKWEREGVSCEYDPIKADVWALGVLALDLASLGAVSGEGAQMRVEEMIEGGSRAYPTTMSCVKLMLDRNLDERPSFAKLGEWIGQ